MKMAVKLKKEDNSGKDRPKKMEKNAAFLCVRTVAIRIKSFFVQQWRTSPAVFTAISALVLNFL